ncbi:MAG: hypothetical protein HFI33_04075 [Lachnospiraceae bacterium]|jgi:hypothetical protein|nr:hypothetical protein [Lachnospiraceae bacterium]
MDIQQDDLQTVAVHQLADIRDIKIDTTKDKDTRIQEFIRAVKNPYCFRCGNTVIKVSFSKDGESFQDLLQEYFSSPINCE